MDGADFVLIRIAVYVNRNQQIPSTGLLELGVCCVGVLYTSGDGACPRVSPNRSCVLTGPQPLSYYGFDATAVGIQGTSDCRTSPYHYQRGWSLISYSYSESFFREPLRCQTSGTYLKLGVCCTGSLFISGGGAGLRVIPNRFCVHSGPQPSSYNEFDATVGMQGTSG